VQVISRHIAELETEQDFLKKQNAQLEDAVRSDQQDQQAVEAKKREMLEKEENYTALVARIEELKQQLHLAEDIGELRKEREDLCAAINQLNEHKEHLENETAGLEEKFQELISRPHEKMVEIAFDGFMSSKMLHAAAEWEAEQDNSRHVDLTAQVNAIPVQDKTPEELVEYLCRVVQICRPHYSKNTILNIAICLTQGFLTVLSGEPGCGKTSICNIFGEALGLNKVADQIEGPANDREAASRYVAVSVERGWTSKRDFVGYYNPLSKTFDKSNRRVYDALHQLDTEKREGICKLPCVILLDEANLSPMEYYWSDFMNICDDLGPDSKINLGEDYIFGIPETLHFVATINNDHTTETLSPRLIDRAWVVTLPQAAQREYGQATIPQQEIEMITWNSLRNAFMPTERAPLFTPEIQECYASIINELRKQRFAVSPRIDAAIKRYCAVASRYFENDTGIAPDFIALDYAIAQRILPKILGNGEEFEKWLEEFGSLCSSNGLNMSAKILQGIMERGNQRMKYYQFFY
jgi:MoxR-like ATPase